MLVHLRLSEVDELYDGLEDAVPDPPQVDQGVRVHVLQQHSPDTGEDWIKLFYSLFRYYEYFYLPEYWTRGSKHNFVSLQLN